MYHWLAAEFGYNREYVDTYINMPSFRAIIKYRKRYPHPSILLMSIGSSLGIKYPKNDTVRDAGSQSINKDNLTSVEGMSTIRVDSEKFKKDLEILDAPSKY